MRQALTDLRIQMQEHHMDAYLIPTTDYHGSEYINDYFKTRKFVSGFTGSAGTLVVTANQAGLWTDGRYFLQAKEQLAGSGIDLYRMGVEGVPTITEFLQSSLPSQGTLGFDGKMISAAFGRELSEALSNLEISFSFQNDLVDSIWADRPPIVPSKVFALDLTQSGVSRLEKITQVREAMKESGATAHLLARLEDIAWLFNLRAKDIAHTPVFFSYALITANCVQLYAYPEAFSSELQKDLKKDGIDLLPYDQIYTAVTTLSSQEIVLLDGTSVNYSLRKLLPDSIQVIDAANPTTLRKCIKNSTEIANTRTAHHKDGIAMVEFLYWIKNQIGKTPMTEISASDFLYECRAAQPGFLDLSFDTIAGYGPHGAIVHYSATPETDAPLAPEGLLLVDSGGHYLDGTTDITRTIALGPITEEMRTHYTTVLRGTLNLSRARFLKGCRGINLDILARGPLWNLGLDFNHGTGHGVGHILSVHEGPNGFRYKIVPERNDSCILEPGMITSDEPGVYIEGSHGIRLENEILCIEKDSTSYGEFLGFEVLTLCPFDRDAIDPQLMTSEELDYLNAYHEWVYQSLVQDLPEDTAVWLRKVTLPL